MSLVQIRIQLAQLKLTFKRINYQVISDHTKFFKSKFNLEISGKNKNFLNIYWTPNLRKHPSKARFIHAVPQCSINFLPKAVTAVLKLMYKEIETYNSKLHYFSGIKSFQPKQNSQPVIDAIRKLNVKIQCCNKI